MGLPADTDSFANRYSAPPTRPGGPVWQIAQLFPEQGAWSETEYLALESNRLIEFDAGTLEILPMPGFAHQLIVGFLYRLLCDALMPERAFVVQAPFPVLVSAGKYREPDIAVLRLDRRAWIQPTHWDGADIVVEVVSEGPANRERDLVVKRAEYAAAGIAEYWIVEPATREIHVLQLSGDDYAEAGVFGPGTVARSATIDALTVPVDDVFAAGDAAGA